MPAVVVAACSARRKGHPLGSDSAMLAALASGMHDWLLVMRSGPWNPPSGTLGGCELQLIRPAIGRPCTAGPLIRRDLKHKPVPVWAEDQDAATLRGFERAIVTSGDAFRFDGMIESINRACPVESRKTREATVVVLTSHPARLDARSVIFMTSLATVAGRETRAIMPRGTRNVSCGSRYIQRLGFNAHLEIVDGPSWMALGRAEAVLVDRAFEESTRYGPVLIQLAEAMALPIFDVPGMMAVGTRDARAVGQPLVESLRAS